MKKQNYASEEIGNLVLKVDKLSINSMQKESLVDYIDIASVDRENKVVSEPQKLSWDEAPSRARQAVKANDILVSTVRPNLNAVARLPDRFKTPVASTGFCALRCDPEKLDFRFLFHWVRTPRFISEMNRLATGASYPAVSDTIIKSSKIPLPALPEQKRIADILDKADGVRRKHQNVRKFTEEFLRAQFVELFGDPYRNPKNWPTKKLEEVSQLQSGVTKGRKLEGKKTVEVPYMRVWNVQDSHLRLGDIKSITVLETDIEKYRLETGDLLLTEGGDPDQLGRGAIWYSPISVCIHQNHIFRVRANREFIVPEFLSAMIGSEFCKRYFLKMAKQTTGIASINMRQLKACPVLLPPLKLQEKFSQIEKRFKEVEQTLEARFEEADTLFES